MSPSPDEVLVVIPAHDEQATVVDCLESVRAAAQRVPVPVRIVVAADSCTDATARLAAGYGHVTVLGARNAGAARRAGTRAALRLTRGVRPWLASTDADSVVPVDWVARQLEFAELGYDVVAGRVVVGDWSPWTDAVRLEYDAGYREGPAHGHVHGANLGLSASALRLTGGFRPLRTGEDVDLVDRATVAGCRVAWSDATPVTTSGRRSSRAPEGFAAHLAEVEERVALRTAAAASAADGTGLGSVVR